MSILRHLAWIVGVFTVFAGSAAGLEPPNPSEASLERVVIVMPDGKRVERLLPPPADVLVAPALDSSGIPLTDPAQGSAEQAPALSPPASQASTSPKPRAIPKSGVTVRRVGRPSTTPAVAPVVVAEPVVAGWRPSGPTTLSVSAESDAPAEGAISSDAGAGSSGQSGGGDGAVAIRSSGGVTSGWRPYRDGSGSTEVPAEPPQSIQVEDLGDGASTLVTWLDRSTDSTGSKVERQTLIDGVWSMNYTFMVGPTARQYRDSPGAGTFRYRVAAVNRFETSAFTAWESITLTSTPPNAPGSLQVSGTTPRLTWSDQSTNESRFDIQRERQSGGLWGEPQTFQTAANVTTYVDAPAPGIYRYSIRAVNLSGGSAWVGPAMVTVGGGPPSAPTGLQATDAGNRRALLSWTDTTSGSATFQIERSPSFPGGVVTVAMDVTGYVDQSGAGTFSYRVRSVNASGTSAFTPWVPVTVADTPPAAPSAVTVSDLGNQSQARVSWIDNANNETSFKIERSTLSGGTWGSTVTFTAVINATSYTDGPGQGTFRYRVAAVNSAGSSAWSAYATITITGGWTVFNPSADSRVIYVSSVSGNDSNSGLSQSAPKRTLAAAYSQLRSGYPDWMLLKSGEVWSESMPTWGKSGRSASEPMLVGSYGAGARPSIRTGSSDGMSTSTVAMHYLAFTGLHFVANTWTGAGSGGPVGMLFVCEGGTWLIEGCLFERYANNLIIQGWPRIDGVKLRRNILWNPMRTDAGNTNTYIDNTDNLVVEENLFANLRSNDSLDNPSGTLLSHNAYLHESCGRVTVIGNIAYNGRTNFSCRPGGLVRDNLSIRAGQGFQIGYQDEQASTVYGNVCTETRDHWNGQPLGQGIVLSDNSGSVVSYNVIANSTDGRDHYTIWIDADNKGVEIKNNVSYNWWQTQWESPLYFFNGIPLGPINIHDNQLQQTNSKLCVQFLNSLGPWVSFANNKYYTSRNGYVGDSSTEWSFSQWKTLKEPTAISQQVAYPAPNRTVGSYNASLGGVGTTEAFLLEAKNNSRANWRPQYTAHAVNDYIRAGFGVTLPN